MSSFGSQIRKRIGELYKADQDVPGILEAVAEGATIEAVRVAGQNTPPNDGTLARDEYQERTDGGTLGNGQRDDACDHGGSRGQDVHHGAE